MFRVLCLVIGYACGMLLAAPLIVKRKTGKDIFSIGSGNPGMANTMRECDFAAGIQVLVIDLLKTGLPCLLARFILFPDYGAAAALWTGLGAVLGHNYPAWHSFHGGKGVAATCAMLFCAHPLMGTGAMLAGMVITFLTKYLSVGALFIPAAFIPAAWHLAGPEGAVLTAVLTAVMLQRHLEDLKRIRKGTEKQVDVQALLRKKLKKK